MIYLELFISFFKIGLFGFGGGYAMLSLIRHEVVDVHSWVDLAEFTDIVAISQTTPGPVAINSATYIGYTAVGNVWGSVVATIAVSLPSIILMLIAGKFFLMLRGNKYVSYIFDGLRPAVTGLIAAAAIQLITPDMFTQVYGIILFVIAFFAVYKFKVSPVILILAAGALFPFLELIT